MAAVLDEKPVPNTARFLSTRPPSSMIGGGTEPAFASLNHAERSREAAAPCALAAEGTVYLIVFGVVETTSIQSSTNGDGRSLKAP